MIGDNETSRKESRGELYKIGVEEMVRLADSSSLTLVSRSGVTLHTQFTRERPNFDQ